MAKTDEAAACEARLIEVAVERGVPRYMAGGLARYIARGVPPGGFLTALLSNDFMEAMGRADEVNANAFRAYAMFLYNDAPAGSFRSPERVAAWIAAGGLYAQAEAA